MSTPIAAPGAAQITPEPGSPPGSAGTPTAPKEGEAQTVTLEQLREILAAERNATFAEIRRSFKPPTPATPPPADPLKPPETKPEPLAERLARIESERAAERTELAKERRDNQLQAAVNALGLEPDDAEFFTAYIEQKHGRDIKVEGKAVAYAPENAEPKSLKDLVSDVYKAHGKRFQPAKRLPNAAGLSAGSGSSAGSSAAHPFSALTYAQIMDARRTQPEQFLSYSREHYDEYAAKKKEAGY